MVLQQPALEFLRNCFDVSKLPKGSVAAILTPALKSSVLPCDVHGNRSLAIFACNCVQLFSKLDTKIDRLQLPFGMMVKARRSCRDSLQQAVQCVPNISNTIPKKGCDVFTELGTQ